ncbi:MAG: sugar phosphate isomerase/epimerase [Acidimicrobiales bacterium]|nr:sugar phosphate isomerase/epimerase [Acidimicrobiales bacterium]
MTTMPPLVLCSGTLGPLPLDEKFRAAAAAGFDGVSAYGDEIDAATADGVDCGALARELGLMVAEVDGVVISSRSTEDADHALANARSVGARSITIVEAGEYDPDNEQHVAEAVDAFGEICDRAAVDGILVHIEPFAWSQLGRTTDALEITRRAGRPNGGLLLDYWHHVRGPDQGVLDEAIQLSDILGIQLGDTGPEPWNNVRNECMASRRLPGEGRSDLPTRVAALAAQGPLPPVGVEIFGTPMDRLPADVAAEARTSMVAVLQQAGL